MRGAKPDARVVRCHGMYNFGVPYAAACGWSGLVATATYILDERRCPMCGGALRPVPQLQTLRRQGPYVTIIVKPGAQIPAPAEENSDAQPQA